MWSQLRLQIYFFSLWITSWPSTNYWKKKLPFSIVPQWHFCHLLNGCISVCPFLDLLWCLLHGSICLFLCQSPAYFVFHIGLLVSCSPFRFNVITDILGFKSTVFLFSVNHSCSFSCLPFFLSPPLPPIACYLCILLILFDGLF